VLIARDLAASLAKGFTVVHTTYRMVPRPLSAAEMPLGHESAVLLIHRCSARAT
jgi:hypothetical protein